MTHRAWGKDAPIRLDPDVHVFPVVGCKMMQNNDFPRMQRGAGGWCGGCVRVSSLTPDTRAG